MSWILDGIGAIVFGEKRPAFVPKLPPRRSPMDDWAALTGDMDRVAQDFNIAVQRELLLHPLESHPLATDDGGQLELAAKRGHIAADH